MAETESPKSPIEMIRSKRRFIPAGFRDEDGVWHNGPHQLEFDNALDKLTNLLIEADSAISHLHHRKSWPLDSYETDRLIGHLRKASTIGTL